MESWIFAAGLAFLALGGALTLLGWNVIRQDRRREAARRELLAQLAFPGGMPAEPIADADERFGIDEFRRESSVATEALFSEPEASGAASRRAAALAVVSVGFAIVIGAYWWFASADSRSAVAPRVELLSLTDHATPAAFVVSGQIHIPTDAAPLRDAVAVLEVMDREGRVLMTVRAPLTRPNLNSGEDAEFSAAALKATNVARYRVKFQDAARLVIPLVDRRQKAVNSDV